ncbi:hypothetical protein X566_19940 [Afipia sp. P52-10]|uniref:hypothetical protein n=1 Tax=Afipia sp. P52-10 TaxID=1429916 RepID=UPI0003DF127C|nr:hypothetical protein [Afipia sp. P52-10]ETR75891.1 hypothetical protein X566_19940 [Afipia sp. P52-10]
MISATYIIVERDIDMRDTGVFTGQIQLTQSSKRMNEDFFKPEFRDGDLRFLVMQAVSSPHIEHAMTTWSPTLAWYYASRFEPHWDESRQCYWAFDRWVVRFDGEYSLGDICLAARTVPKFDPSNLMLKARQL